ncbi:MAG: DNA-formamidopyrimidine glycosylase family protein [Candidatus Kuenenbacteria bacterium]
MAELPQIKRMRREIVRQVTNRKITGFQVFNEKILKGDRDLFMSKIVGSSFKEIWVMGKVLIFKITSGYFLFCNLFSNGEFVFGADEPKYIRAVFEFQGNLRLYLVDKRSNATFEILDDSQRKRRLVYFGTDPLGKEFTFSRFIQILRNKRTSIFNFLKNQKYIYGIGDEYADKICAHARVSQDKGIRELGQAEVKRLYRSIRRVLKIQLQN